MKIVSVTGAQGFAGTYLPLKLADELRIAENDHWRAHILYLIKEVIVRGRFGPEVRADRAIILESVNQKRLIRTVLRRCGACYTEQCAHNEPHCD